MTILLNDEIFSANLAYQRKRCKLSQLSLARQSGISVHYLRAVEKGRLPAQFLYQDYQKLCSVLRICPMLMGSVLLE